MTALHAVLLLSSVLPVGESRTGPQPVAVLDQKAWHFAISPDGKRLVCITRQVKVVDTATRKTIGGDGLPNERYMNGRFLRDGTILLTFSWGDGDRYRDSKLGDIALMHFDFDKKKERIVGHAHRTTSHGMALTSDEKWLVTRGDQEMVVWNLADGKKHLSMETGDSYIKDFSFNDKGTLFSLGLNNGTVKVFSTKDWKVQNELKYSVTALHCARFIDDERLLIFWFNRIDNSGDFFIRPALKEDKKSEQRLTHGASCCARHPKSSLLAIGGFGSGKEINLQLYDAEKGGKLVAWNAHDSGISDVIFSPDGKLLYSCGYAEDVKVWDVAQLISTTESGSEKPKR